MDKPILEYVKEKLTETRGEWPRIAAESGVPYGTVVNIAQGKVDDPRISSMQKLLDWFKAHDAMLATLKGVPN